MPFILEGYNDFYEGWLARVLDQPQDIARSEEWLDGYDMADETGPVRVLALRDEIKLGHVTVRALTPAESHAT